MKNNAIDYLIDLVEKGDCNAWLSYIIKFFIENKGIIDDNVKNDLADYLLQRKKYQILYLHLIILVQKTKK